MCKQEFGAIFLVRNLNGEGIGERPVASTFGQVVKHLPPLELLTF